MAADDPWIFYGPDGSVPANRPGTPITVYRVNEDYVSGEVTKEVLPNVRCTAVKEHMGDTPSAASFRYVFDGRDPKAPQSVEDALSTANTTRQFPHLVEIGDRLAVAATRPDGVSFFIFDGFVYTFGLTLNPQTEAVTMAAVGVAARCFDYPVPGAVLRACDKPETVNDFESDLPGQFNPGGEPNATPGTGDSGDPGKTYPVFLDPNVTGTDAKGDKYPRTWDLAMAAAYLIFFNNDESFVSSPKRSDLDKLLVAREPRDGTPFDPNDSSTYDSKPINAPDTPLRDNPWPTLLNDMIRRSGFGMTFALSADGDGNPQTALKLSLLQGGPVKQLMLQARGSRLDPALSNVGAAALTRDLSGAVNEWVVLGAMERYEASFVLACGFPSAPADATSLSLYDKSAEGFADSGNADTYRVWIYDESGEGHYANTSTDAVTTVTSLDDVLGSPDTSKTPPEPKYINRRRPPRGKLITRDASGRPLNYSVAVSTDYAGPKPGPWDGTGTWHTVFGCFELLKDRIGVRLTVKNPNHTDIGRGNSGEPFESGKLNVVECLATPDASANRPAFFVRLTCVIEGDYALTGLAERKPYSPVDYPVSRTIDASDRLFYEEIAKHSQYNNDADPVIARDDTDAATAEAVARRTATEAGLMEGDVTIPRFTCYYQLGDRIDQIQGRNLPLRTDNGGVNYAPVLPIVVARQFTLEPAQSVTLTLSDADLDRTKRSIARTKPRYASRADKATRAKEVSALATQIQKAGFGVATDRI